MAGERGATGTQGARVQRTGGSLQAERMRRLAWRRVWSRPRGWQQVNRCPKKPDGQGEPLLIAPAGSGPPEGPAGWTLRLPADRCAGR